MGVLGRGPTALCGVTYQRSQGSPQNGSVSAWERGPCPRSTTSQSTPPRLAPRMSDLRSFFKTKAFVPVAPVLTPKIKTKPKTKRTRCELCKDYFGDQRIVGCCNDGDCPKHIENMCNGCGHWDSEKSVWLCWECR